jgi:hypothetical protein
MLLGAPTRPTQNILECASEIGIRQSTYRHVEPPHIQLFGFFETAEGANKWLGHAGMALLFVTLICFQGAVAAGAIDEAVVHLDDLQVALSKEKAEELRKETSAEADVKEQHVVSAVDQQRINQISSTFERAFGQAIRSSRLREIPAELKGFFVREEIQNNLLETHRR